MNKELPLPQHDSDVLIFFVHESRYNKPGYALGYFDNSVWSLKVADTYVDWPSKLKIINWQEIPDIMRQQYRKSLIN